jgi:hypothetical protein
VDSENIDQEFDIYQTEAKDIDDILSEKGQALAKSLENHDTANDNNLPLKNTKTVKNKYRAPLKQLVEDSFARDDSGAFDIHHEEVQNPNPTQTAQEEDDYN